MRKISAALLCLAVILGAAPAARAVSLGEYHWNGRILDCIEASEQAVFALEGMGPDERAVLVSFEVSEGLFYSQGRTRALYGQLWLQAGDGARYATRGALRRDGDAPVLSFLFAIPWGVPLDSLAIALAPDGAESLPAELAGDWVGAGGGIRLQFSVGSDGSGTYTFEQSGYTESRDVYFFADGADFVVDFNQGNELGITRCYGTYARTGGMLTLDVKTAFESGRLFEYSIPCIRDASGND